MLICRNAERGTWSDECWELLIYIYEMYREWFFRSLAV